MFSSNTSRVSADANYIEDVFSTYLYTGTGSAQTITNGIDLAGKGGMLWTKCRNTTFGNFIRDSARTNTSTTLITNSTDAQSVNNLPCDFLSNGFLINAGYNADNGAGNTYASWTFRKQAKFFDVVTYTGNGVTTGRQISHNLGSVPGCIIVKGTSAVSGWRTYHRSLGATKYIQLQSTAAAATYPVFYDTDPTSTVFTIGDDINQNGVTYVAYLFAHDAGGFGLTGADNVITCGSYTGTGATLSVNLGYEPQWLLIKNASAVDNWLMFDSMRGLTAKDSNDPVLYPNSSGAEVNQEFVTVKATGFDTATAGLNISGNTYIYIAIRRGPMKTPTSGTSVYNAATFGSGNSFTTAGFPVDFILSKQTAAANDWRALDRLRGTTPPSLYPNSTAAESAEGYWKIDNNTGVEMVSFPTTGYQNWMFQRSPSFLDVVCYTGDGVNGRTITHNLTVTPEMMIVKNRTSSSFNWCAYHKDIVVSGSPAQNCIIFPNTTAAAFASNAYWNNTAPTSSVFSVGYQGVTNGTGSAYVAYLFATCPGVSKVGSYTGSGTTKQIDCGFTNGARFVLIKRTDSTGDWYVWDTTRGIVSGNDPYLLLNSLAAGVTNTDYIDTYSAGFELSSTAPAALNANGGSYIFLAIA